MYKYLFLMLIVLCGCKNAGDKLREKQLQDTLAKLKLKADFKPLTQADAYAFLNDCYLPRLDSLPTKRRLYVHPLLGTDFKELLQNSKAELEIKFSGDSDKIKAYKPVLYPPVNILFDKAFKWDSKKLKNVLVTTDTSFSNAIKNHRHREIEEIHAWHKTFGYGYMCVSYPFYNKNSNILNIKEWVENAGYCGTGRDKTLWYKRVGNTWISLNY